MKFSTSTLSSNIVKISSLPWWKILKRRSKTVRWPDTSAQMFSRNFRFVRSGLLLKCFSLEIIFLRQSREISGSKCNRLRCAQNLNVVSLRTSTRNMPKKAKVARGTQQSHDPDPLKQGGEEGTKAAISLNKDGQIYVKFVAKPGAKQSNITGKARTRPPRLPTSEYSRLVFASHVLTLEYFYFYVGPLNPVSYQNNELQN